MEELTKVSNEKLFDLVMDGSLKAMQELSEVLSNSQISKDEKKSLIENFFKELGENLSKVLCLTIDKNRENDAIEIFKEFKRIYYKDQNFIDASITTAKKLSEEELKEITEVLSKEIGKRVKLTAYVDESLIGGVKVDIAGRLIDNSIKGGFDDLRRKLKSNI